MALSLNTTQGVGPISVRYQGIVQYYFLTILYFCSMGGWAEYQCLYSRRAPQAV